jgi:hypothetical protein
MVVLKTLLAALLVYPSYANFDPSIAVEFGQAINGKTLDSTDHSYFIMGLDTSIPLEELENSVIELNDQDPSNHNCYLATFT